MKLQKVCFFAAIPFCLYLSFMSVISIGWQPGMSLLPAMSPGILVAPCLLLGLWSMRVAGLVIAVLTLVRFLVFATMGVAYVWTPCGARIMA